MMYDDRGRVKVSELDELLSIRGTDVLLVTKGETESTKIKYQTILNDITTRNLSFNGNVEFNGNVQVPGLDNKYLFRNQVDNVSELINDVGYITSVNVRNFVQKGDPVSDLRNDAGYLTMLTIPPGQNLTDVGELNNDVGYLTEVDHLDDIKDVVCPNPKDNQVLGWDGSNWVNTELPIIADTLLFQGLIDATAAAAPARAVAPGWYYINDTDGAIDASWGFAPNTMITAADRLIFGRDRKWNILGSVDSVNGIDLTDFSVTQGTPSGGGALAYDNAGVFSFIPAKVDSFIELNSLSVDNTATASGSGNLTYDSSTGKFDFIKPDLSHYKGYSDFGVTTNPSGPQKTSALTYSASSGQFTFTPVTTNGLVTNSELNLILDNYTPSNSVNDGKLTITGSDGKEYGVFTADQAGDETAVIPVQINSSWTQSDSSQLDFIIGKPTKTSQFNNDGEGTGSKYVTESGLTTILNGNNGNASGKYLKAGDDVSELANDAKYVKEGDGVLVLNNDAGYITAAQAPAQVNSDWGESNSSKKAFIKNKPTINNKKIDFLVDGNSIGSFTTNQSTDKNITIPPGMIEPTSDGEFVRKKANNTFTWEAYQAYVSTETLQTVTDRGAGTTLMVTVGDVVSSLVKNAAAGSYTPTSTQGNLMPLDIRKLPVLP